MDFFPIQIFLQTSSFALILTFSSWNEAWLLLPLLCLRLEAVSTFKRQIFLHLHEPAALADRPLAEPRVTSSHCWQKPPLKIRLVLIYNIFCSLRNLMVAINEVSPCWPILFLCFQNNCIMTFWRRATANLDKTNSLIISLNLQWLQNIL